jgi:hypothetical protein
MAEMLTNYVFLLNADQSFFTMIQPAKARKLQDQGKAAVFRYHPYVLILRHQIENPVLPNYILKIDPGSQCLLTVETWIKRLMRFCSIVTIEIEEVRFDTQKLVNPEINGVECQQGELLLSKTSHFIPTYPYF